MTQFTRIYVSSGDNITHVSTQDSSFVPGTEFIEVLDVNGVKVPFGEIWDLDLDSHTLIEAQLKIEFEKVLPPPASAALIAALKRRSIRTGNRFVEPRHPRLSRFGLKVFLDGSIVINEFTRSRQILNDLEKIGPNQAPRFKARAGRTLTVQKATKR